MGVAVERIPAGNITWELEHCDVSIRQLQTLGENSHTYGISDAGIDEIFARLNYWFERKEELLKESI